MYYHHHLSWTELNDLMPWEREILINLTSEHVQKENRRMEEESQKRKARMRSRR